MEQKMLNKKIEEIEDKLNYLEVKEAKSRSKKLVSLKGIFEGKKISEEDIEGAKKSLFKINS